MFHMQQGNRRNEVVFIKMRYPKRKGFTEVKAYLKNEGQFICEACFEKDKP